MDDAVSPPPAAHGLNAAVVVAQSEVSLRAVIYELPLAVQGSTQSNKLHCQQCPALLQR